MPAGQDFRSLMEELDAGISSSPGILTREADGVVVVALANTPRRNAMTLGMWQELESVFTALRYETSVAAVVVRGMGRDAFAAGADISEFPERRHDVATSTAYNGQISKTLRSLAAIEIPTIAAIQGFAVGGGCELSHACDLRIASETSKIGIPIGKLGVILGVTEAKYLVRHIGVNGLKRVLYSGRLFDAGESLQMRLVDELVSPADFWDRVQSLTATITGSRPTTMRAAKVITDMAGELDDYQADRLHELMIAAYGGPGLREGFNSFLEKRSPDFGFERGKH